MRGRWLRLVRRLGAYVGSARRLRIHWYLLCGDRRQRGKIHIRRTRRLDAASCRSDPAIPDRTFIIYPSCPSQVLPPIVLFLAIFASPSSPQSHSFPPHLIALSPLESWSSLPLCLACSFLAPPRSALTLRTSMQINHCPRSFIRRHHHHVDLCLSEGDDSHGGTAFVLSARYSDLRKASRFQTPRISQGGAHSTGEHLVLPESKDFLLE